MRRMTGALRSALRRTAAALADPAADAPILNGDREMAVCCAPPAHLEGVAGQTNGLPVHRLSNTRPPGARGRFMGCIRATRGQSLRAKSLGAKSLGRRQPGGHRP